MSAKVFISCGQATADERLVAAGLERWFSKLGFEPYVAIQSQSLSDVNSGIVGALRRSDFYVFVDFRRELLSRKAPRVYRGSLFTNQELAIAYMLGFENAVFVQQTGVELNGLMRYMASNAARFATPADVLPLVRELVKLRRWDRSYTRHLAVGEMRWSEPLIYGDHTGQRPIRVLYVDVHNRRPDVGALSATARLEGIVLPDGTIQRDVDFSPIKATGKPGYEHVIWPRAHAAWDFLSVHLEEKASIYLNSALDIVPRQPSISSPGAYVLGYAVFAEHFPVLRFGVQLVVYDDPLVTQASLVASPFM